MQMRKLAMVAAGLTMMLGFSAPLGAQSKEADPSAGGGGRSVRWAGEKQRRQWQQSVDAGDVYPAPGGSGRCAAVPTGWWFGEPRRGSRPSAQRP